MTSIAMDDIGRCKVCEEELMYPHTEKNGLCTRCETCPFCSSVFTAINLNGIVVERRCQKCNAYTETYLD